MLDDIVFTDGDIQNFIVEIVAGTLNPPLDILTESNSNTGIICNELPAITGGGGNIFIMSD